MVESEGLLSLAWASAAAGHHNFRRRHGGEALPDPSHALIYCRAGQKVATIDQNRVNLSRGLDVHEWIGIEYDKIGDATLGHQPIGLIAAMIDSSLPRARM